MVFLFFLILVCRWEPVKKDLFWYKKRILSRKVKQRFEKKKKKKKKRKEK